MKAVNVRMVQKEVPVLENLEKKQCYYFNLNNCLELTSGELDLIILANIQAFTRNNCIGIKRS